METTGSSEKLIITYQNLEDIFTAVKTVNHIHICFELLQVSRQVSQLIVVSVSSKEKLLCMLFICARFTYDGNIADWYMT
jgi:hypothetical protein